jgi:hypothetical protein
MRNTSTHEKEKKKVEEKELTVLKFCIEMKPFLLGPNSVNCSRR